MHYLRQIGNLLHPSVVVHDDEDNNEIVRTHGDIEVYFGVILKAMTVVCYLWTIQISSVVHIQVGPYFPLTTVNSRLPGEDKVLPR